MKGSWLTLWWRHATLWTRDYLGIEPETTASLLQTGVVLLCYLVFRRLINRFLLRRIGDPSRTYRLAKVIDYALGVIALMGIARIWISGGSGIGTYLGILSAGLAIALQDPIVNIAGWMFILAREPFRVGDRVEIGGHAGDIVDVRLFMFSMLEVSEQSTGRIIHVPNGRVFKEPCVNHNQGFDFVWNELPVLVTFESDWKKAHRLLSEIVTGVAGDVAEVMSQQVARAARDYRISYQHLTPIVWVEVLDSGVNLVVRYLCDARAMRSSADRIWRAVLDAFAAEESIDFAYPTKRFYDNATEGKTSFRGK